VVAAPASALQPPDLHTVDLVPGSDGSYAAHFTHMGAWDYFYAYESGRQGLWRTNGATTELVTDQVEVASYNSYYRHPDQTFAVLGTYLYFAGSTAAEGQELWRTDGVNTELVKNIAPGTANGVSPVFKKLGAYVYFSGGTTATGLELWRTNGSSTSLVKEIEPGTADSNPYGFFEFNGKLYFSAFTTLHGAELWRTDGTSAGTVEFDLAPGAANSFPGDFTIFQNRMFFLAGSDYFHLWYATGDSVSEFPYTPNDVHDLTVMGSSLYFAASDIDHGRELWVTTGDLTDPAGTSMLKDIWEGSQGSFPMYLTAMGSRLYFTAYLDDTGRELWSTNGLPLGTSMVADLHTQSTMPGENPNSDPKDLTVFAGSLYLHAITDVGPQLIRVDSASSFAVQTVTPLPDAGLFSEFMQRRLTVSGDKLYVQINAPGAGQEYAWMQAPAAPASVAAPVITGTAKVGKVLTGARGSWSGVPSAITSAQWYRCTSAGTTTPTSSSLSGCVVISGATKATYKAVTADKGKYLRLRVKAQNESGTVYRWSKATVKIAP
jgi:ELWxxDGT repeat protein